MKVITKLTNRTCLMIIGLTLYLNTAMAHAQVVAVVSTQNPVSTLKKEQIADIFLGNTSRFPDGSKAVPIDQTEGSAVRDEFYLKFSGKSPAQIKAHWSKIIFTGRGEPPREVSNSAQVKKRIASHPHDIGYIDQSDVDDSVKVLIVK